MKLLRATGKNGSALPGLIMEKLYPNFLFRVLSLQEKKIILITGTNGKTTTTKMLVAGLRATGARVVTNSTGSNMTRGLIAALIEDMTYLGGLKKTDWFVFEMDEAYTPKFTSILKPKMLIALNVLRDQLDRYGEIDKTAKMIGSAAKHTDIFIYSALDPLLVEIGKGLSPDKVVKSFGVAKELLVQVKNEESTHGQAVLEEQPDFILYDVKEFETDQIVDITSKDGNFRPVSIKIPIRGFHNALNANSVYSGLALLLKEELRISQALEGIKKMPTPFGRGEQLVLNGKNITVALVKNPSGFASNLTTFVKNSKPDVVLFVVNDRIADGRDVSWLWDVTFSGNIDKNTTLYTSGIRGYDMALRLKHDNIKATNITKVDKAISSIMKLKHKNIVVIPTYTALFEVRMALSKYGKVPRIW